MILAFGGPSERKRETELMQQVVEKAVEPVRATLPPNIEFKTRSAAGLSGVVMDATQIHLVIVNLATNAAHTIGDRKGVIGSGLDACEAGPNNTERTPDFCPGQCVGLCVGDN